MPQLDSEEIAQYDSLNTDDRKALLDKFEALGNQLAAVSSSAGDSDKFNESMSRIGVGFVPAP